MVRTTRQAAGPSAEPVERDNIEEVSDQEEPALEETIPAADPKTNAELLEEIASLKKQLDDKRKKSSDGSSSSRTTDGDSRMSDKEGKQLTSGLTEGERLKRLERSLRPLAEGAGPNEVQSWIQVNRRLCHRYDLKDRDLIFALDASIKETAVRMWSAEFIDGHEENPSLENFLAELGDAFTDPHYARNKAEELMNLQRLQGESIQMYVNRFRVLAREGQVGIDSALARSCFVRGVQDRGCSIYLGTKDWSSGEHMLSAAQRYAAAAEVANRHSRLRNQTADGSTRRPAGDRPANDRPTSRPTQASTGHRYNGRFGGRLSTTDHQRYMDEGRCFNCGELGHRATECSKPQSTQTAKNSTTMSSSAAMTAGQYLPINDQRTYPTLGNDDRLRDGRTFIANGQIGDTAVKMLVDPGATNSIIHMLALEPKHLREGPARRVTSPVLTEETLTVTHYSDPNLKLWIGGLEFPRAAHMVTEHMENFQMIVGQDVLQHAGWDLLHDGRLVTRDGVVEAT